MTTVNKARQKPRLALATLLGLIVLLLVFLLLVVLSAHGPGGRAGATGDITLSNVVLRAEAKNWYLNADADIDLPPTVRAGLDNGVPLQFIIAIKLKAPRRYWLDKTVATFERRYQLTFYELTRHYRVESMADGSRKNYRSLLSALDGLGTLRKELVGVNKSERLNVDDKQSLVGSMRVKLDSRALPLPLQPLLASSWRLASEAYVWPVN